MKYRNGMAVAFFIIFSFLFSPVVAQNDPVVMTVNGKDVLRSEFEYSYNKNNSEGVIDKKTVEEYVDLFVYNHGDSISKSVAQSQIYILRNLR